MCLESWQSSQEIAKNRGCCTYWSIATTKEITGVLIFMFHSVGSSFSPVNVNVTHCFPFQSGSSTRYLEPC
jgi:hypothetical protein